jgi:hypothetical protein
MVWTKICDATWCEDMLNDKDGVGFKALVNWKYGLHGKSFSWRWVQNAFDSCAWDLQLIYDRIWRTALYRRWRVHQPDSGFAVPSYQRRKRLPACQCQTSNIQRDLGYIQSTPPRQHRPRSHHGFFKTHGVWPRTPRGFGVSLFPEIPHISAFFHGSQAHNQERAMRASWPRGLPPWRRTHK